MYLSADIFKKEIFRFVFKSFFADFCIYRILTSQKKSDGKSVSQAFDSEIRSEDKLDLIRLALAKYR